MYLTKIIERFGDLKMATQSIDDMCNKMEKEGYSLVTYQFYADNERIILTFKKK